ncbi:uncharacterized protein EI90DRAFT_3122714 [Cantharellus anzutake]|uniref:uncharacterized protein n=1 Tax=Cantharellus anzutake TaxID=1750568 RepID=UPI0019060E69|nr:uncharacterized protein EI90DRAFT_3122714 [Cantharellus anzutake]KAF8332283.1 hypothetical protein EI90DRAFT_3122714 [Cantharellus anzutake]
MQAAQEQILEDATEELRDGLREIQENPFVPSESADWDEGLSYEQLVSVVNLLLPRKRTKGSTWGDRMTKLYTSWTEQLPVLANFYLHFKTENPRSTPAHYPAPGDDIGYIHIHCLDIFDGDAIEYIPMRPGEVFPACALIRAGYLCPTPMEPQLAISLQSLELLHSLFRVAPAFTFQHFSRLLANMHKAVYKPYSRTQVSLIFDIFYRILSHLDSLVKQTVGYDEADHHLKTSCPACHNQGSNLIRKYGDGNTSLSRMRHHFEGDLRHFNSDYYLPRAESVPSSIFIADGCLGWKNAQPIASKTKAGAMQIMDETGIFSVVCRHGIVQFLVDMIESGELIFYLHMMLAARSLKHFQNPPSATLHKANFKSCTGSFHGAAHNRSCQLEFLIGLQKGAGIEDGEGNEVSIRKAMHLPLPPDTHHHTVATFEFTYTLPSGMRRRDFLLNNHTSAWRIIKESAEVLETMRRLCPTFDPDSDCPRWLQEERQYIASLRSEPESERRKIEYLEAIECLERAEGTVSHWISRLAAPTTSSAQHTTWHLQEANKAIENARATVMALEAALDTWSLSLPWTTDSPQHLEAITLRQQRDYHQLLDELEHHAISRQFEVEKVGLPRTGITFYSPYCPAHCAAISTDYKARQQILSLVSKRGKTLQSTINKYNALAASMSPPRTKLTWKEVTDLNFISDIVTLCGREDIREKPWAKPLFRNATRAWCKLQRAREEIETVVIEANRLGSFVRDEEAHLQKIIEDTRPTNPHWQNIYLSCSEPPSGASAHTTNTSSLLSPITNPPPTSPTNAANRDGSNYANELLKAIDSEAADKVSETENIDVDEETEDYHNLIDRLANTLNISDLDST